MSASYSLFVKADGSEVVVKVVNSNIDSKIRPLGVVFDSKLSKDVKFVADSKEKARVFASLRDIGILFSDGREWCPAELFEYFRGRGLLMGHLKGFLGLILRNILSRRYNRS